MRFPGVLVSWNSIGNEGSRREGMITWYQPTVPQAQALEPLIFLKTLSAVHSFPPICGCCVSYTPYKRSYNVRIAFKRGDALRPIWWCRYVQCDQWTRGRKIEPKLGGKWKTFCKVLLKRIVIVSSEVEAEAECGVFQGVYSGDS